MTRAPYTSAMVLDEHGGVAAATVGFSRMLAGVTPESVSRALCPLLDQLPAHPAPAENELLAADVTVHLGDSGGAVRCDVYAMSDHGTRPCLVMLCPAGRRDVLDETIRQASRAQMLDVVQSAAEHDFRDSLNAMAMNVELLARIVDGEVRRDDDLGVQKRCLTSLRQELKRIERTLGASRVGSNSLSPAHRVALRGLIDQVVRAFRLHAKRQAVSIDVTGDDVEVVAEEVDVRHALFNVLLNAFEAMPKGGRLTVTITRGRGEAMVRVGNSGAHLSRDDAAAIWEPFVSAVSSRLGLGLPVARRLMAAHGGSLGLDPDEAAVCFVLTLPLAR